MAFQKCPVCEGTGKSTTEFGGACNVWQGYCIINSHTGLPPIKTVTTNYSFVSNFNFGIHVDEKDRVPPFKKFDLLDDIHLKCPEEGGKCVPPTQTEE